MCMYDMCVVHNLPDYVAPLVELERQIPVTPYPPREGRVHDGLRRGADRDRLL